MVDPISIPLTCGKFALVDTEDYPMVSGFKWHASRDQSGNWYAMSQRRDSSGKKLRLKMHREIMQAPRGVLVDHHDGNGLNNRRHNLRLCNKVQNSANVHRRVFGRSRFRGVYWNTTEGKWQAQIGKTPRKYLGRFTTEKEAALAYDAAARERFGDFAKLNCPDDR